MTQTPTPIPPPVKDKDDIIDLAKAMLFAALIAITVRTFAFEPFNIPSSSMYPTLLVGDYLFVEKYAYGYSKYSFPLDSGPFEGRIWERRPQRGDIAVFRQPQATHIDYIKRIVGLPGDKIHVYDGVLHINGAPVQREYVGAEDIAEESVIHVYQKYLETLPNGRQHAIYEMTDDEENDNTEIFTVPDGHYFAMGDNRDRSLDSRAQREVGFVPAENLIGRASFIFFSTEGLANRCHYGEATLAGLRRALCLTVSWPKAVRYDRLFKGLHDS